MRKLSISAMCALAVGASIALAQTETTCTSTLADRVNFLNSATVDQNVKMRQSWDCPPVSENDKYGFTLDWEGPAKPIWMADPTIVFLKAKDQYGNELPEGWYYITGTCDELGAGNFQIYKTKDFKHYFMHKMAFSDHYDPVSYDDRLLMPKPLQSGVNYIYGSLYSPHLFVDPANPDEVHIIFTATRAETPSSFSGSSLPSYSDIEKVWHYDPARSCDGDKKVNPIYPWDAYYESLVAGDFDEAAWWDRIIDCNTSNTEARTASPDVIFQANRFQAMFVASMPVNDFVNPSTSETFSSGSRQIRWFGYRVPEGQGSNFYYDGGQQLDKSGGNRFVPSYANAYNVNNCDQDGTNLETMSATGSFSGNLPFGTWHRVINYSGLAIWAPFTSMVDGGCAFFDPNDSSSCSASQGWVFYGWQCVGSPADDVDPNNNIAGDIRGNHIAGAKLLRCASSSIYNNDWEFGTAIESSPSGFDTRSSLSQFACRINDDNPPTGQTYNGQSTSGGTAHLPGWGVAESPSVVWDESLASGGRYVLSFSRNFWDSPAYCVVYRTAANASSGVKALRLDTITDTTSTEHMLVSSRLYKGANQEPYNFRSVASGRSYGSAEFFYFRKPDGCYVVDSNGQKTIGIIFHAKLDDETHRTVFFKNLTRSNGLYSELIENDPSGAAGIDTWKFQVPKYCFADFDKNGYVNGTDYDDFADAFDVGSPSADINEDGAVNGDDFDFFAICFDEGC